MDVEIDREQKALNSQSVTLYLNAALRILSPAHSSRVLAHEPADGLNDCRVRFGERPRVSLHETADRGYAFYIRRIVK